MNFNIPKIGQSIVLSAPWTFTLIVEAKNDGLVRRAGLGYLADHAVQFRDQKAGQVTLPAGTTLEVDKIYLRKGKESLNSVTFIIKNHPNWGNEHIRFFASLGDVNSLQYADVEQAQNYFQDYFQRIEEIRDEDFLDALKRM